MKVWLLNVGEPLPVDSGHPRLHRTGIFAEILAKRGFDVVWWSSSFRHAEKDWRFPKTTAIQTTDRLKVWCLASRPYRRNVSFQRILANRDIASEFRRCAASEPVPDIIVCSYPIPELARAGSEYAATHSLPSVVDIRDLWPDIWATVLPSGLRWIGDLALLPFVVQSKFTLCSFSSICAITDEIVGWGVDRAGRPRSKWDRVYPLAYPQRVFLPSELAPAKNFWSALLTGLPPAQFTLCYVGSISHRARIDVAISAMRALPSECRAKVRLILCGDGEALDSLRKSASDLPEIIFPGWVSAPQIQALASFAHAGILPYPSDEDFRISIPNKAIEYLAHGLPILASLKGPVFELITTERCGLTYQETDPNDLAQIIIGLVEHPEQLGLLSSNAHHLYQKRFLAESVCGSFADMLSELASVPL